MERFRRSVMWLSSGLVGLLAYLSILGASYGAERAKVFFNSAPLMVFWCLSALLLILGFAAFPNLTRKPSTIMIHAGCLLVLAGGMWGSATGHRLRERLFGVHKIPFGYMAVNEGEAQDRVFSSDFQTELGRLPFSIYLTDFRVEYYEAASEPVPRLSIKAGTGEEWVIPARANEKISPGGNLGKIEVMRVFRNFKIAISGDERVVSDTAGPAENPAIEVRIEKPDGTIQIRYVFERFEGHKGGEDEPALTYLPAVKPAVRDFISELVVMVNGKAAVNKRIEVNHPLHYGGYHFYQHSYDSEAREYTVLSVVSDSGLYTIYAGYALLLAGVFQRFWLRNIKGYFEKRKAGGD